MSDITVTAAQVAALDPIKSEISTYIANEALTRGDAVYILTTGKVGKVDADAAGTAAFRGICLQSVGAGEAVDVLQKGLIGGFAVSALNADAAVYSSGTAGKLGTTAGSTSSQAGRVHVLTDKPTYTKVLRINVPW